MSEWKTAGKVRMTPKGEWDSTVPYSILDTVYNEDKTIYYIAKKAVPAGVVLTNNEYWDVIIDVDNLVDNLEIVGNNIKTIIASTFDPNSATPYSAGTLVWYENELYRFIDDHTGAWTGTDVVNVSVGEELSDIRCTLTKPEQTWTIGAWIKNDGSIIAEGSYATRSAITDLITVQPGDMIDNSAMAIRDADGNAFTLWMHYYVDGVWDSRVDVITNRRQVVPQNINGIRFSFTISNISMTQAIIDQYIVLQFYLKPASYKQWLNSAVNIQTLENLIYKNDKTNIVPEIMAYYKGKSQMASVADMPAWSYIYASGTEAAALLPDFDFTLTPNRTYIIECRTLSYTENIRLYRVYVPSTFVEFYVGYKRSDSETYLWNDVKAPQDAASDYIVQAVEDDIPEMFVYTDFAEIPKYWTPEGSLGNDSLSHTQNLRIIPGGKCYVRNVVGQACQGAWFDQYGRWIAPLLDTDMTDYVYKNPDCGSGAAGTYVTLKEFTAPVNAHYLSLNLVVSQQYKYMSFLASKPVFPLANTGNILVPKGYAAYQAKKGKKLCIIGPSTAMIGRRYIDKPASNPLNQFLCGWQEYIAPWYALCESYGFSGGSYGTLYTTYKSIYDGIVTDALDLSGYDDYILMASTNGLSTTGVGDWGNVYDEPGTHEHDTYMGGLRGVVDYIMQQNSMANIYLMTMIGTNNYFGSTYVTYRNNVLSINDQTRDMALKMHLRLIDLAADCGFNAANIYDASDPTAGLTYDGVHYNQAGCYLVGSAVRHRVIGI